MGFEVINILKNKQQYNVSRLVTNISISSDINEAASFLQVDYVFQAEYSITLGSLIIVKKDGIEMFRGYVVSASNTTKSTATIKAYDIRWYLLKNYADKIYENTTASNIMRGLCTEFSLPVGNIVNTDVKIRAIYRNQSLFDIITDSLTKTTKVNGVKYIIKARENKLFLEKKANQLVQWKIENGVNLISADLELSIEDMANKIVIIGENNNVIAVEKNSSMIESFGVMQFVENDDSATNAEARQKAKELIAEKSKIGKEFNIECIGIAGVEAGTALYINIKKLNTLSTFYVKRCEHNISGNNHTMSLELNYTDEVAIADVSSEK